jgi:hypothetical protein
MIAADLASQSLHALNIPEPGPDAEFRQLEYPDRPALLECLFLGLLVVIKTLLGIGGNPGQHGIHIGVRDVGNTLARKYLLPESPYRPANHEYPGGMQKVRQILIAQCGRIDPSEPEAGKLRFQIAPSKRRGDRRQFQGIAEYLEFEFPPLHVGFDF